MSFQIHALPKQPFAHLFTKTDTELAAQKALRRIADKQPGFPCRVSLQDAEPGEEVILLNYEHLPADSPFQSRHAIYIRPGAAQANLAPGEVPAMLRTRTLSLRAFTSDGMLVAADLAEGTALEPALDQLLAQPGVAEVHLHFAKPGCYAARATRR